MTFGAWMLPLRKRLTQDLVRHWEADNEGGAAKTLNQSGVPQVRAEVA